MLPLPPFRRPREAPSCSRSRSLSNQTASTYAAEFVTARESRRRAQRTQSRYRQVDSLDRALPPSAPTTPPSKPDSLFEPSGSGARAARPRKRGAARGSTKPYRASRRRFSRIRRLRRGDGEAASASCCRAVKARKDRGRVRGGRDAHSEEGGEDRDEEHEAGRDRHALDVVRPADVVESVSRRRARARARERGRTHPS